MSNYCPAVSANNGYYMPLSNIMDSLFPRKRIEHVEKRQTIVICDQDFTAIDIQTVLIDINDIHLNKYVAGSVQYIKEYAQEELVHQALTYIYILNEKTKAYENLNFPPLSVSLPEDGELLVEWNFEHYKIGLSFETNSEDSSWYIVHDGTVKKMTAWGYLNSQTEVELMDTILSQVVENAS
jgi:hypothetical protein